MSLTKLTVEEFAMIEIGSPEYEALEPAVKVEFLEWHAKQLTASARRTASGGPGISKADFLKHGGYPTLRMGDTTLRLEPQEFSSGSYGWGYFGKLTADVNGVPVKFQASINIVVAGSKPAA
jgi:hypothetical protein